MTAAEAAAMSVLEAAGAPGIHLRPHSQGPNHGSVCVRACEIDLMVIRELWSWYVPHETAAVIADQLEEQGRRSEAAEMRRAWRHAAGMSAS